MPRHVLGSTADLPALRAQLEALVTAGEHAQVIETLFEILERLTREHSDLAARYTSMLRQMYRSKSEKVSSDQLALFLAQLPANETAKPPDEPPPNEPPPNEWRTAGPSWPERTAATVAGGGIPSIGYTQSQ